VMNDTMHEGQVWIPTSEEFAASATAWIYPRLPFRLRVFSILSVYSVVGSQARITEDAESTEQIGTRSRPRVQRTMTHG
jgi:hypothetical protein